MKIANRGISGDTTRGMLIRLEADVLALQPKAVVMLMGTNDLEEGAEPEVDRLESQAHHRRPEEAQSRHAHHPLSGLPQLGGQEASPGGKIKKINELYAAAVKGDPADHGDRHLEAFRGR
jgi:lysophospholipase L1-like esterase